jgi:hypothetical protein
MNVIDAEHPFATTHDNNLAKLKNCVLKRLNISGYFKNQRLAVTLNKTISQTAFSLTNQQYIFRTDYTICKAAYIN